MLEFCLSLCVPSSRDPSLLGANINSTDLSGYGVEARDGSIGKVDEATYDTGSSYLIVDTGPWIFGKKVMLPAGVVLRVDTADEKVYVTARKTRSRTRLSSTTPKTRRIATSSAPITVRAAPVTGTGKTLAKQICDWGDARRRP